MDRALFESEHRRMRTEDSDLAGLILNGCSGHDGDFVFDFCMEHNIVPFPIPPLSANHLIVLFSELQNARSRD
jgi:hypothetical protein